MASSSLSNAGFAQWISQTYTTIVPEPARSYMPYVLALLAVFVVVYFIKKKHRS